MKTDKNIIAIGCDHAGFNLKLEIKKRLHNEEYEVEDFGCHSEDPVEYPDIALNIANSVAEGNQEFGIIICGTGIGVSIVANKVHGIRAALCADCFSACMAKEHNNANIITLGGRTTGSELAWQIVNSYMNAEFQRGIHESRVSVIDSL